MFERWDWSDLPFVVRSAMEIGILAVLIYLLLLALERISAGGKIKGISLFLAAVVAAWMVARILQLHAITWLLQASIGFSALILVVVFQPELRRLFTRLGGFFPHIDAARDSATLPELVDAIVYMASRRIGALIVVERTDNLDDYINSSPLDCELTAKSMTALFWKDSPLHDGAVILRGGRIAGAGVILPLTNNVEFKSLSGTRHRAAIGISEDTDALALVVSEETGAISMADKGSLTRGLSRQDLEVLLGRIFRSDEARRGGAT
ncbi:MAG: diadenylate cyclase [Planctomycetes bacterium]|nr:diadenylate cyclase [Planctomycetota bacterium]